MKRAEALDPLAERTSDRYSAREENQLHPLWRNHRGLRTATSRVKWGEYLLDKGLDLLPNWAPTVVGARWVSHAKPAADKRL